MARPVWKGHIAFGLVNIPVSLYSGIRNIDLDFDLIDSRDMGRVRYERVNEETGDEVPWDEIVKGFEYEDGNYALLSDEDFKRAAPEAAKTVEIEAFVDRQAIDSVYFEKPYYLAPEKPGEKAYVLLRETLEKTGKIGAAPLDRGIVRYSDHILGKGSLVFQQACNLALEGVVSKQVDSPYQSKRTRTWVKTKCILRQEFVIGGYTDPKGARKEFGALLVGYFSGRDLVYAGRVGTGFVRAALASLARQLRRFEQDRPPFKHPPGGALLRGVHWIRPALVAEVEFHGWTSDNKLRQPSFKGLRQDKPPRQVVREVAEVLQENRAVGRTRPGRNAGRAARMAPSRNGRADKKDQEVISMATDGKKGLQISGVALSHPERILFPEMGVTKLALAEFYERIAGWILPYVTGRPLSLLRCPGGRQKQCFFQKHFDEGFPSGVSPVKITEDDGEEAEYMLIRDLSGLIGLVQMGVLELHPWGSRAENLERPDLLVFDLDPGEGLGWQEVIAAARLCRQRLADLGLQAFVKTSGGKGLHVVVPITPGADWEQAHEFGAAFAKKMADEHPQRYTATLTKSKRKGKIFIDYLRNTRGATSVAAYSTRARPGAPVSTPLSWEELSRLESSQAYHLENLPRRLTTLKRDPWEDFFEIRQELVSL